MDVDWIDVDTHEFKNHKDQSEIFLIPELKTSFENSYFNVVTESVFHSPASVIHHSEKSFRPFYYYQFPIFVASLNHVQSLRDEYGFDTFDDVIDHSYDFDTNPKSRLEKVVSEIHRINSNKEFFIDFYKKNKHRFYENREIYEKSGIDSKIRDFNFFWNFSI